MQTFTLDLSLDKDKFLSIADYFSDQIGTSLFFSGSDVDSSKNSFIALFPKKAFSLVSKNKKSLEQLPFENRILVDEQNCFEELKKQLGQFSDEKDSFPLWIGYLSYEFGKDYFPVKVKEIPLAYFFSCAVVLQYEHESKKLFVFLLLDGIDHLPYYQKKWIERFSLPSFWKVFLKDISFGRNNLTKQWVSDFKSNLFSKESKHFFESFIQSFFTRKDTYIDKIKDIQKEIEEGEVYEVNLSHEIVVENIKNKNLFSLFYLLSKINPAPFSAFIKLNDFSIISSSPERFLFKEKDYLEARPIKGTINRGKTEKEDIQNLHYLLSSEKEKSELRMITDLLRNDFYPVCKPGSIEVKEQFKIEKYANVFHMVSIITGKCNKGVHPVDIIKACFPGGSITGCPKKASQNSIAFFEKRERGIYTGSIGYFTNIGDFDFNLAIRTLLFQNERIYLPVGGAILFDSDPEKEFLETYYKAESMLQALCLWKNQ